MTSPGAISRSSQPLFPLSLMFAFLLFLGGILQSCTLEAYECNGHSVKNGDTGSGDGCHCELPYSGEECELCADGFYGNPNNGSLCYLGCSSGNKLLSGFSIAGLSLEDLWLHSFCVWVVSPSNNNVWTELSSHDLVNELPVFDITLQSESTDLSNSSLSCGAERILVYRGLPDFLPPMGEETGGEGWTSQGLLAVFSGPQIHNLSLTVTTPVMSVVYVRGSGSVGGYRFIVAASPTNSSEEEDGYPLSPVYQHLPHLENLEPVECNGRYHHASVYDPSTNLLWMYGGRDIIGTFCRRVVAVNLTSNEALLLDAPNMTEPKGRYMHSAVLVKCCGYSSSPRMLVYGGVMDGLVISSELWAFSGGSWQQLASPGPGYALAGHTASVADSKMVVIGGVLSGLHMSPHVLQYDIITDTWETLVTGLFGPPGLYGHCSVYDSKSHSILVFGGYKYQRPHAALSSTLYSLDLSTHSWSAVQLATQVEGRAFHSLTLVDDQLVVYGGLTEISEDKDVCPSAETLLISKDTECNGKHVATVPDIGSTVGSLWGHSSVRTRDDMIAITGGFDGIRAKSSVTLVSVPDINCSVIVDSSQCLTFSDCALCLTTTDPPTSICYNQTMPYLETDCLNSTVPSCGNDTCDQFVSCGECMSTDISQMSGCVWCTCTAKCIGPLDMCDCTSYNPTDPTNCFLDVCLSASCTVCTSQDECQWISNQITEVPGTTIVHVSSLPVEWSCVSDPLHQAIVESNAMDTAVIECPGLCSSVSSCHDCLATSSPNAGNLMCQWTSYSGRCLPEDMIVFFCAAGACGSVVSSQDRCPPPCSQHVFCYDCLEDAGCVWELGEVERCTEVSAASTGLYSYVDCPLPECPEDCHQHGLCVSPGNCSCDFGYVGEYCEVECGCHGHSHCPNATEAGRMVCLDCIHNTQGPFCSSCLPFHVGTPTTGKECVPCEIFCHGNSEICLRMTEYEDFLPGNFSFEESELLSHFTSGPSPPEAVCVNCAGASFGLACELCEDGYFNLHSDNVTVDCTRCQCNGHGDTCDPSTGVDCICRNNTMTSPTVFQPNYAYQCNTCELGYHGVPLNNSQCYQKHGINTVYNYTLAANQSIYLGVSPIDLVYSDIDVRVTLLLDRGSVELWVTEDAQAVQVRVGESWEHVVTLANGVQFVDKGEVFLFTLQMADATYSSIVYHSEASVEQVIVVPNVNLRFQANRQYFTVRAQENSKFYFYYRQDPPRLNLVVFFGVFLSCFCITACITVLVWNLVQATLEWRRSRRHMQQQGLRSNRPFGNVVVCLAPLDRLPVFHRTFTTNKHPGGLSDHADTGETGDSYRLQDLTLCTSSRKDAYLADKQVWPVVMQPTRDHRASVSTVLVQLPSSRCKHQVTVCTGSTLVHNLTTSTTATKRKRFHKNQLVPKSDQCDSQL